MQSRRLAALVAGTLAVALAALPSHAFERVGDRKILVFAGRQEPNGYTERALTHWRQKAKANGGEAPGNGDGTRTAVLDDDAPSPAS